MPKNQQYDFMIKLLIVGDSGVGKTNILLQFCQSNFLNSHLTTIGIDFRTKTLQIDDKKICMRIWDTAGQERFKTITQTYYRGSNGIFLTYAINDRESFENVRGWLALFKEETPVGVVLFLIGNKSDSKNRQVSVDEGRKLAKQIDAVFYETSAKSGENIQQIFVAMASAVKNALQNQNQLSVISFTGSRLQKKLTGNPSLQEQKDKCC